MVFNFLHPSFSTSKNPKNQSLISTPTLESRLTQSLFTNNQLSPQSTKTTTSPSNSQRNKPNNPKNKPRETKEKQSQRTKKNPSFFVYARNLQQPFSTTTNNNSNYKHKTATTNIKQQQPSTTTRLTLQNSRKRTQNHINKHLKPIIFSHSILTLIFLFFSNFSSKCNQKFVPFSAINIAQKQSILDS